MITLKNLPLYERMLRESSREGIADEIAVNVIGRLVLSYPRDIWRILDEWCFDESI